MKEKEGFSVRLLRVLIAVWLPVMVIVIARPDFVKGKISFGEMFIIVTICGVWAEYRFNETKKENEQ